MQPAGGGGTGGGLQLGVGFQGLVFMCMYVDVLHEVQLIYIFL